MENEFNKNLQTWLNDVATTCDKFAKEIDLDFYPFQSPLPKGKVDLLIVGINPGGDTSYKAMLVQKSKDFGKVIDARSSEMLASDENMYAVKPQWEIGPGNDIMRTKLKRVFITEQLQNILLNSIVMNMYYFNTQNTAKLGMLSKVIKEFCITKTTEFFKITNPNLILFFTTSNYELSNCGVKNIKPIGNYMKEGILNGQKILAMPNPGYYIAYSYDNGAQMGNIIQERINN
jgi:hypothetical protein